MEWKRVGAGEYRRADGWTITRADGALGRLTDRLAWVVRDASGGFVSRHSYLDDAKAGERTEAEGPRVVERDPLQVVAEANRANLDAMAAYTRSQVDLADAVFAAHQAGHGYGTIAGRTSLSRARVQQIVQNRRARESGRGEA